MKNNKSHIAEWFKQADYDFATAKAMLRTRRYIYAVFMCHLSVEKALKGFYCAISKEHPPKIHDLVSLVTKSNLKPAQELKDFIGQINQMSIVTRYPDSLAKMHRVFSSKMASKIIKQTKETLKWIKEESTKL